ncbi:hypothetical protein DV737_g2902, partial [Chaetothyriales sp. CBS 132003]
MDLYTFLLSLFWGEILLYLLLDNLFLPSPEALRHLGGLVRELGQNTFEFAFNGLCSAVHRIVLGLVNFSLDVCHRVFFGMLGCYKAWTRIAARGRQSMNSNYAARPTGLIRGIRERQARALIASVTARHATPEQEDESSAQEDGGLARAETPVAAAEEPQEQSVQVKEEEVAQPATVVAASEAGPVAVDSSIVGATPSACESGGEPLLLAQLSEAFRAMEVTPGTGDTAGPEPTAPVTPEPATEKPWLPSTPSFPPLPSLPSVPSLPSLSEAAADEPSQQEQLLDEEPVEMLPYAELWSQIDTEFGGADTLAAELDAPPPAASLPPTIDTSIPEFEEAAPVPMELDAPLLSPPPPSLPRTAEVDDFDPYASDNDAHAQFEKDTTEASRSGLGETLADVAMGEADDPYASDNDPYATLDEELEDAPALVEHVAPPPPALLPRTIETSIPGLGEALPDEDDAAAAHQRPGPSAAASVPYAAVARLAPASAFNAAAFRGRDFNFQPAQHCVAVGPAPASAPARAGVVAPATAAAAAPKNTPFAPPASPFWDNTCQMWAGANVVVEGQAASTAPPPADDRLRLDLAPFSPLQMMRDDDAFGDAEAECARRGPREYALAHGVAVCSTPAEVMAPGTRAVCQPLVRAVLIDKAGRLAEPETDALLGVLYPHTQAKVLLSNHYRLRPLAKAPKSKSKLKTGLGAECAAVSRRLRDINRDINRDTFAKTKGGPHS